MCKKDLLQLDFEGILKYFRVSLPKKCRTEDSAKQLMKTACSIKVKKLKKYETDFIGLKGKFIDAYLWGQDKTQLERECIHRNGIFFMVKFGCACLDLLSALLVVVV